MYVCMYVCMYVHDSTQYFAVFKGFTSSKMPRGGGEGGGHVQESPFSLGGERGGGHTWESLLCHVLMLVCAGAADVLCCC